MERHNIVANQQAALAETRYQWFTLTPVRFSTEKEADIVARTVIDRRKQHGCDCPVAQRQFGAAKGEVARAAHGGDAEALDASVIDPEITSAVGQDFQRMRNPIVQIADVAGALAVVADWHIAAFFVEFIQRVFRALDIAAPRGNVRPDGQLVKFGGAAGEIRYGAAFKPRIACGHGAQLVAEEGKTDAVLR